MSNLDSLRGIRVVEIGDNWTTALCGKLLLDLGAEVTRFEMPWGDGLRDFGRNQAERDFAYSMVNGAKKSVSLSAGDLGPLTMAVDGADVVLVTAHVASRLGYDLAGVGPDKVVCRFSPFGIGGPLSEHVASDLTLQAVSGVMATTGLPGGRPLRAGTELAYSVASLYGAIGALACLIERERSSLGQIVEVPLYNCLVSTLTNFASRVLGGQEPLGRLGNQGPNSAPWELFESSDREYVFIIAGSDPTFERLCDTMGRSELLQDPRFETPHKRREHAADITGIVQAWAGTLSRKEIVSILRESGVPVSPVARVAEVLGDEHFASRSLLTSKTAESGGEWPSADQPLGFGHTPNLPDAGRSATLGGRLGAKQGDGSSTGPLAGIRVVDFGTLTAGPFAARLLGNLGADVIKIEPLQGETGRHSLPIVNGQSVYFHITNNGKRSLSVNLREPTDVDLVAQVAQQADVLIENQAPGALSKRGLGADGLLEVAPHLIYTSVSGYGHEGFLGGYRAYDTVIQAGAGLMSMTGEEGGIPLKTGISTADVLGSLAATTGTLAALFGRTVGRHSGVRLDTALYDILAWSMQMAWVTEFSEIGGANRYGNGHWLYAPHETFETADDRWVAISCESEDQWGSLAKVLESELGDSCPPGLAGWSRSERWDRREQLNGLIASFCVRHDSEALVDRLQAQGVPCEPVVEVVDVFGKRQQLFPTTVGIDLYTGDRLKVTEIPIELGRTPALVGTGGPELGAENELIRDAPDLAWERVFGAGE
jgi:crotonobetainyl-CoA:carnitine CoA-transferase CaiB-like acyl-CoA transferase